MTVCTLDWKDVPPATSRGGVVTIGNFDGVHRGHAVLVEEVRRRAAVLGAPAVATTFETHPLQLLRPEQFQPVLTTASDRAQLLARAGAENVVLLRTTPELLQLTAEVFFQEVIHKRLQAQILVEGVNFGFGRNRGGNIETLAEFCKQSSVELIVVPPVMRDGKPISSSRVRNLLLAGHVGEARELMNRHYRIHGRVGTGQQRGRTIGFPTANLESVETLIPGDGVYAVRAYIFREGTSRQSWPGAANIGPNPTFGEHARKVEVHLIGFQGELVGQRLAVDFLERIRETRPFPSVDSLVEQLHQDVDQARRIAQTVTQ